MVQEAGSHKCHGWVRPSPASGFSYLQTPMPVEQRKVKGTPSDINVIYEAKDEGKANTEAGPAAVIAASPSASPWRLSAIILGPVCLILLILVIVMALQVYQQSQKSEQELEVIEMENIILSDTLQQLTTGKAANVSPSQRLVKIRRRKRRTRDDMFSELQMSSHADRAQQNAWRQSMSDYRKAQYEREKRWWAESRDEQSKWRAEDDRWRQLADRRQESMLRLLEHQIDMLQHMV
ncbi:uncharacterized protein LOC128826079 isoform X4 [Malaclemys terrapin pileata]|uniref:uncharacterized protein LOC128826079 isoform X4 n=1 Tax=Malaclemys terrapin pileata TaxID=2991368 RepID=UPI0023A8F444|nr:uncharacterized protein LOC128826079 isoform X4 [Malaclemys terrapin pileata]